MGKPSADQNAIKDSTGKPASGGSTQNGVEAADVSARQLVKKSVQERYHVIEEVPVRHGGSPAAERSPLSAAAPLSVLADECGLCTDPVLSSESSTKTEDFGLCHDECIRAPVPVDEPEELSEAELVMQELGGEGKKGSEFYMRVEYLSDYYKVGSPFQNRENSTAPAVFVKRIQPLTLDYEETIRREAADLIEGKIGRFRFTVYGPRGKETSRCKDIAKLVLPSAGKEPTNVSRETSAPAGLDGFIETANKLGEAVKVLGYERPSRNGEARGTEGEGPKTRTALTEILEVLNVADALKKRFGVAEDEDDSKTKEPVTVTAAVPGESPWVKDAVAIGQATGLSEFFNGLGRQLSGPLVNLGVSWLNNKLNEKRSEAGKAGASNAGAANIHGARQLSPPPETTSEAAPAVMQELPPEAMPLLEAIVSDLQRSPSGECDVTQAVSQCVLALQFHPGSKPFFESLLRMSPLEMGSWLAFKIRPEWNFLFSLPQTAEFCQLWQADMRAVLVEISEQSEDAEEDVSRETSVGAPTVEGKV